jgi:hypothetical protein
MLQLARLAQVCVASASKGDDKTMSMSVIRHFEAESDERAAYLKMRRA